MRTKEFYKGRRRLTLCLTCICLYALFTTLTFNEYRHMLNTESIATNYKADYVGCIQVDNIGEHQVQPSAITLRDIQYDTSTTTQEMESAVQNVQKAKVGQNINRGLRVSRTHKVPTNLDTTFKGYMCLSMCSNTSSAQYRFMNSGDFDITTDELGFVRYGNYYVVAMGTGYSSKVGSTFRITLDSGKQFDVILGDIKADRDTDSTNTYRSKGDGRGEVVEFIIACGKHDGCSRFEHTMSSEHKAHGSLEFLGFQGNVVKVEALSDTSVVDKLY